MNSLTIKAKPSLAGRDERRRETRWRGRDLCQIVSRFAGGLFYLVCTYLRTFTSLLCCSRWKGDRVTVARLCNYSRPSALQDGVLDGTRREKRQPAFAIQPGWSHYWFVLPAASLAPPPRWPTLHTHALLPKDISNSKLKSWPQVERPPSTDSFSSPGGT